MNLVQMSQSMNLVVSLLLGQGRVISKVLSLGLRQYFHCASNSGILKLGYFKKILTKLQIRHE